jgi:hypothetical protein
MLACEPPASIRLLMKARKPHELLSALLKYGWKRALKGFIGLQQVFDHELCVLHEGRRETLEEGPDHVECLFIGGECLFQRLLYGASVREEEVPL